MKIFLTILIFLNISAFNHLFGNEIFKQLTINDGLAHTDANCLAQDSTGLIWIGTYAGLQSYDGYSLQTFNYYPEEQKIFQSHNRIHDMACTKDKIWLGTASGLTCFDLNTHSYMPYHIKEDESEYDFNSAISQLFSDNSGSHLWIKTGQDMVVARICNDTLHPLKWNSENERILGKEITGLQFQGTAVWAVADRKIVQLGIREEKVAVINTYDTTQLLHQDETALCIFLVNDFLYIRTGSGCYRMSTSGSTLHKSTLVYTNFHQINPKIPAYTNGEFTVGKEGTLWCAYAEGIFEVQYPFSETPSIRKYLQNAQNDSQSAQRMKELLIDSYNNLWVATSSWGVFYHPLSQSFFKNISQANFKEMGFSQNEIVSITGHKDGSIWMIVEYASLFKYDPQTEKLMKMPLQRDNSQNIYLQYIEKSHNPKYLYIGTNHGILVYNIDTQTTKRLQSVQSAKAYNLDVSIANMHEDGSGRLWVGTWGHGVFCIDQPLTAPAIAFHLSTQTDPAILSNKISQLFIHKNSLFLCTTNGLNRLTLTDTGNIKTLSSYQTDETSPATSLSTNYLASIDCENDSVCWIGTIGGGLNKVVLHSEQNNDYTATHYTTKDGLINNDCEIVLLDQSGNVWIGGNEMAQFDISKNKIYTYGFGDGLLNNAFKVNVSYKGQDGNLYMGGLYGLSYFQPNHFTHNTTPFLLTFTNLFVNNEQIIPHKVYDGSILLESTLNNTSKLTLNHRENNFTITFAALGYNLSEQIMYRYRLKGFQKEWRTLRYTNNEIFFSNLPYDSYQLEVQLSTDKGYTWQNTKKTLEIAILPPWYLSGWAQTGYVIIVLLVIIIAFRQYNKEQNLKKENEIQKILIAQDEEKYQAKMQFFMNASHELKTPLTLILLAAEKLIDESKPGKECKSILYNVKRMLTLISELVDIRKQDLGITSLNLSNLNMSEMLRQLFEEISSWAENKQIKISYDADTTDIKLDADKEKIGKMILNLFSNAIKYTDIGGQIDITFKRGTQKDITPCYDTMHCEGSVASNMPLCILTVKDTGVGISSESIRLIYERFFQVNGKTQSHLGSGIGLAIVKSIVLQHKGMIIVSSERMAGSEFIVALPISNNMADVDTDGNEQMDIEEFIESQYNEFQLNKSQNDLSTKPVTEDPDLPTLLIVEDNEELQAALKEQLSPYYNIHIADNGRIGLEKCMSIFPDIIISDVMMPEMDGIEMCRRIKNNLSVAYIPIVLLTAKGNVESQIEGYESGADLYIPKPFSMKLLNVNLQRLLKQREQWFKGNRNTEEESKKENKMVVDNQESRPTANQEEQNPMVEKLKKIIEENISDPNLSPDQLSSALGISRTKLYRDLKGIDGQSLSDYIRNFRLEKAAHLLLTTQMNVQEVMNEVGFVNSSHFTKIFKLRFNMPPTEYKKKH